MTSDLDNRIRAELTETGEQWLTWTQLADALRAVLDLAPHFGAFNANRTRETIATQLGIGADCDGGYKCPAAAHIEGCLHDDNYDPDGVTAQPMDGRAEP